MIGSWKEYIPRKVEELLTELPFSASGIGIAFGLLSFLLRVPFLFRYDNHFGGDSALSYVMALDILKGARPLYSYGADYVAAVEPYIMALVFKVFSPSIVLGGAIQLVEWSVAVAIGVYLLIQGTDKFYGVVAGLTAAVGVPFTMTYTTVPEFPGFVLLSMLILLQVYWIVTKGDSFPKILLFGFTMGVSWYISKKCLPAMAISVLVLAGLRTSTWDNKRLLRPLFTLTFIPAVLLGYFPEIWHRLHNPPPQTIIRMSNLGGMENNLRITLKCLLAYFDAQPVSRMRDSFYYWVHLGAYQLNPQGIGDWLCLSLGGCVSAFIVFRLFRALVEKKTALLLLGGLVVLNVLMMVASNRTGMDPINARRYFLPAAISLSLWTGYFFAAGLRGGWKTTRAIYFLLLIFFLGRVLFHNFVLLTGPDELREVRWVIREMNSNHLYRGLSYYGTDYLIMGLTNEETVIAEIDGKLDIPSNEKIVAQEDNIAVIGGLSQAVPKKVNLEGRTYQIAGDVRKNESLWWAPYKVRKPVGTPALL
jgi:hypothetical protein